MKAKLLMGLICISLSYHLNASLIFSTGTGSAVTTIDRQATFDSLTSFNTADLSEYTESQLNIQSLVSWQNHPLCGSTNGCWYGNGGINSTSNNYWTVITGTDGANMQALEFAIYSGGGISMFDTFKWEAYKNGIMTSSDAFAYNDQDIYGFNDVTGFDELRIAIVGSDTAHENWNVIGIDNLNVQLLSQSVSVPLPTSLALFGLGLIGLIARWKNLGVLK